MQQENDREMRGEGQELEDQELSENNTKASHEAQDKADQEEEGGMDAGSQTTGGEGQ